MVRIRDVAWALAAVAVTLAGSRPAPAAPITLTGNVATDFTTANGSIMVPVDQGPGVIAGPTGSTAGQLVSGVDVQNVWLNYNAATDTMNVGIQGYKNVAGQEEIFGDNSGNPNPSLDANPNFGGLKSVAIAFAPVTTNSTGADVAGTPAIIAGIPQDKSSGGSGTIDGFTVSKYNGNSMLEFGFGQQLSQYTGNLVANPSAAQPDMEFTIKNFSQIPGLNFTNGLALEIYSGDPGSPQDGKVQTQWIYVPAPQGLNAPEPTTWVAWLVMAGGAGWRSRRRWASRRSH